MTSRAQTTTVFVVAGAFLAAAGVWGLVMFRADARHDSIGDPKDYGPLTAAQYAAAVSIADHEVSREDARLTSATAITRHGHVKHPNLGAACTSHREIRIRLIGHFPHITVSPDRGAPSGPVTSVAITADGVTGRACELSVRVGRSRPYRHAADLMPALAHR